MVRSLLGRALTANSSCSTQIGSRAYQAWPLQPPGILRASSTRDLIMTQVVFIQLKEVVTTARTYWRSLLSILLLRRDNLKCQSTNNFNIRAYKTYSRLRSKVLVWMHQTHLLQSTLENRCVLIDHKLILANKQVKGSVWKTWWSLKNSAWKVTT